MKHLKVYDNGEKILSTIESLMQYLTDDLENSDMQEEIKETLEELKNMQEKYGKDAIVCIRNDCGMGISFDVWEEQDLLERDVDYE